MCYLQKWWTLIEHSLQSTLKTSSKVSPPLSITQPSMQSLMSKSVRLKVSLYLRNTLPNFAHSVIFFFTSLLAQSPQCGQTFIFNCVNFTISCLVSQVNRPVKFLWFKSWSSAYFETATFLKFDSITHAPFFDVCLNIWCSFARFLPAILRGSEELLLQKHAYMVLIHSKYFNYSIFNIRKLHTAFNSSLAR